MCATGARVVTPSDKCLQLIAAAEAFRARPYLCPAGIPTIGYGSTAYGDGRRVALQDPPISQPDAWALLGVMAGRVAAQIVMASKVALTQGQLDALTSFAYNTGVSALTSSTLWRKLQAGDTAGAAAEFPKWVKATNPVTRQKEALPGLVARRAVERQLFEGTT